MARVASRAAALCFVLAASSPAAAQSSNDPETDGPSIKLGETDLYPSLRLDAARTDNVYRTAANEIAASSVIVTPRLLWVADRRLITLRGTYDGEYAGSDEPVLEHADHRLGLVLSTAPGNRLRAGGSLMYLREHQAPGTSLTRGRGTDLVEPVTFDEFRLDADARYGADRARGNVALGVGIVDRSYVNLEEITAGYGYSFIRPYGRFSLRVSGDTRALVELRFTDVDFDADARDRQDVSLLGGLSFLVTGRSSGELKVGAARSEYASEERASETTLVVEGQLDYAARAYSRLALTLVRELDNTFGNRIDSGNGGAVRDIARLAWEHDWSERLSQTAFASYERITLDCPQLGQSEGQLGLELELRIRRWLGLGASGEIIRRVGDSCDGVDDALVDEIDHDTSRVGLFVRARL